MENEQKEKYNNWNLKKQDLQFGTSTDTLFFNEAEIWWCSLGINIGAESFGKGDNFYRPILIIKKLSNDLCVALPITSKRKVGTWFYNMNFQDKTQCVMLYQIRVIHKKRLYLKIGQIENTILSLVKEKLENLLELSSHNHSA